MDKQSEERECKKMSAMAENVSESLKVSVSTHLIEEGRVCYVCVNEQLKHKRERRAILSTVEEMQEKRAAVVSEESVCERMGMQKTRTPSERG